PDAKNTTVVVLVDMAPDGSATGVTLVSSDGPTQMATQTAYDAAKRAVVRCAKNNRKPLPADDYAAWKQIEMTFDPNKMRLK
ncbi:MAG: cell envelope integrity protein TolA, partial [Deltaproteobacteria bacterium]